MDENAAKCAAITPKESSRWLVVIRKQDTSDIHEVSGSRRKQQEKKNQITSTDLLNYNINTKNSVCGMSTRKEWEMRKREREHLQIIHILSKLFV